MMIDDFIQQHGGYSELARKLALGEYGRQIVRGWKLRNRIPESRIMQMFSMGMINAQEMRQLYDGNSK